MSTKSSKTKEELQQELEMLRTLRASMQGLFVMVSGLSIFRRIDATSFSNLVADNDLSVVAENYDKVKELNQKSTTIFRPADVTSSDNL